MFVPPVHDNSLFKDGPIILFESQLNYAINKFNCDMSCAISEQLWHHLYSLLHIIFMSIPKDLTYYIHNKRLFLVEILKILFNRLI